jgi:uncharacterized membrane protein
MRESVPTMSTGAFGVEGRDVTSARRPLLAGCGERNIAAPISADSGISAGMTTIATARESQLRSILKAISYRITGTISTAAITYLVTGEILTALAVGSVEPFVKIVIYYVHERLWLRVPVGTIRQLARRRRR